MNRQRSSSLYNRKLAALAVILLALAVVFWMVMRYSRSHMIRLAELEFVRVQNLQQPSSPSPSLEHGIQAFHDGNYSSALISLGQHLQEHPDSYFGSFYSGLARIKSAPLQILGVTLAFDPEAVRLALRDMQNARKTAANPRQTANCLWFAARSHLMLGRPQEARKALLEILELEEAPERVQDARGLLQRLEPVIKERAYSDSSSV